MKSNLILLLIIYFPDSLVLVATVFEIWIHKKLPRTDNVKQKE